MAQQPFLKSIRPVNLLSFGPDTEEIELRPLNILIGPNGSGKSNFIEILGLLSKLPDKDPWSTVIQTGGAPEWIWKGKNTEGKPPTLSVTAGGRQSNHAEGSLIIAARRRGESKRKGAEKESDSSRLKTGLVSLYGTDTSSMLSAMGVKPIVRWAEKPVFYSIALQERDGAFEVVSERFHEIDEGEDLAISKQGGYERPVRTAFNSISRLGDSPEQLPKLTPGRSVLSMPASASRVSPDALLMTKTEPPRMREFAEEIERFAFYRDWVFGGDSKVRDVQPVGLDSYRLARDSINLAQVLKAWRDRGDQAVFDRLIEMLRKFYEPVKDVDTELLGTHLRIMIKEDGLNSRTPASRLSDGTLRWLMLLIVLLDPTPPPVICIDEPELGLHPDILPTLADLLRDASTRTQLILTTHSRTLVECFSDDPESVCVCEKVDGATEIKRLEADRLKVWLEKYSLGQLWLSGEIGGNRW
ncbi:MAG: AAA family ATPase [Terracidiphilus sp.]|jgi:predicted ATPase